MKTFLGALILCVLPAATLLADEPERPASERFAAAGHDAATPDFQKHMVPLLSRLGCNGRACHGSFQGRGGFRLSLFGYDPAMDYEALTKSQTSSGGTLVDADEPDSSAMIEFPTDGDIHEGGQRFARDSWQHHLITTWIRNGMPGPAEPPHVLEQLEVTPAELVFAAPRQTAQLRVVARWADGSREDVTCLCRFQTNNEAVVEIDESGHVTSLGPGDTHVVAFYENGVTAVPVLMPVSDQVGEKFPAVAARTEVDRLVLDKLRKLGTVPAEVCGDAEFLRRVSLDMIGTLPAAAEVEAFLADTSPDKRQRKIDELLGRPEYAAWWATRFCDLTGNNPQQMGEAAFRTEQSQQWYNWIRRRLEENAPYDQMVAGLLLARGRQEGQDYHAYAEEMTSYVRKEDPADFAERLDMPHYWSRNSFRTPEDRVLGISYAFLGLRIQCAQCHKHPFDRWTQDDFRQFTGFFRNATYGVSREARDDYDKLMEELGLKGIDGGQQRRMMVQMARDGKPVPFRELFVTPAPAGRNARAATARLLGAETIDLRKCDDPRQPVMDWLRRPDNPFFARAIANRLWAHYFGVGIIDPPDDLNLANPPSNRELLDHLAAGFIQSGFDLKWLHREITGSDAYQRGWQPNETNLLDRRNFSRALPRRLPAEVAYDAVIQATASDDKLAKWAADPGQRAIGHASLAGASRYAMQVFGKPERTTTCDCERSSEPTLLQSVYLLNDQDTLNLISSGGWATEAARRLTPAARKGREPAEVPDETTNAVIREAYLRTISRPPADEELAACRGHLAAAATVQDGLRDLLWALLNTKEFVVNH
ncbi:MAG: DUF1549 domain-containing protein [Pirellulaceae bacterium]|nr:DUF1549 domain-containing protein [Pirellulaceae bacterium]